MITVSRRSFITLVAGTGTSLVLGCGFEPEDGSRSSSAQGVDEFSPHAYLSIDTLGQVTVTVNKSDMGQGIRTTFAMLVAEELDADWTKVKVLQAPGDSARYGSLGTGGSGSTRGMNRQLRSVGATAKAMLVSAAATNWGVDAAQCHTNAGRVTGPGGKSAAYGDLVVAAKALPVPTGITPKQKSDYKIVGKATNVLDATDIVTGKPIFAQDLKIEGAVFAVLLRPPHYGARATATDDTATKKVPGVLAVVPLASGVAVVAMNTWAAIQGRDALKVTWSAASDVSTATLRASLQAAVSAHKEGAPAGDKVIEAVFELPYLAHATMEPINAIADVREGSAEVWTGSQSPDSARSSIARNLGMQPANVTVHNMRLGGGFGRKFSNEWVMEAVEISKQVKKPVKLVWTRECDIQRDSYRPMSHHAFKGTVSENGQVTSWSHQYLQAPGRAGGEYSQNAYLPYDIPGAGMKQAGVASPVPTGPWRSVEHSQIVVANECFMDELAHAAGEDPMEFRIKHAREARIKAVLLSVKQKSGWGQPLPAGVGRGVACFSGYGSCIAHVVEVKKHEDGFRVTKMTAVVDPGIAVNPRGVEAQVQGAFMDGVATALYAAINIEKGGAVETNFDGYQWARMSDAPQMAVFVEGNGSDFGGMGEVGYPSVPAAIANAVFSLTKKRVRKFPIRVGELV